MARGRHHGHQQINQWTRKLSSACMCAQLLVMSDSATLRAVALHTSLSMGFSRQEYWSGLPWPSPGDLPHPGIERASAMAPDCWWILYC